MSPYNLRATSISSRQISLEWSPDEDYDYTGDGYIIERRSTDSIFKEIARVPSDMSTYTDKMLEPDTQYYYRVSSYNNLDVSIWAPVIDVKTRVAVVYTDISDNHPSYIAFEVLGNENIIPSINDRFFPGILVSRSEFVSFLIKALIINESPVGSFLDVSYGHKYYNEIMTAYNIGIITGDRGYFNPGRALTKQDMAVITARAMRHSDIDLGAIEEGGLNEINDAFKISSYAKQSMEHFISSKIMIPDQYGNINPLNHATREDAANIIYNIFFK